MKKAKMNVVYKIDKGGAIGPSKPPKGKAKMKVHR
jgi:hypothetical protein